MLTPTRHEQRKYVTRKCLGKRRFNKDSEARLEAQKIQKRREVVLRVYECDICKGFHLSSNWKYKKGDKE